MSEVPQASSQGTTRPRFVRAASVPAHAVKASLQRTNTVLGAAPQATLPRTSTVVLGGPGAPLQRLNTVVLGSSTMQATWQQPKTIVLGPQALHWPNILVSGRPGATLQRGGTVVLGPPTMQASQQTEPNALSAPTSKVSLQVPLAYHGQAVVQPHQQAVAARPVVLGPGQAGVLRPVLVPSGQAAVTLRASAQAWYPPGMAQPAPVAYPEADPARTALAARELLAAAFYPGRGVKTEPRQLRIIIGGLMGSGKSTMCRMLQHLLNGKWVNQDEFSDRGKGAKRAFLAEIEKVAADAQVPVLLVDKINTMRQHRQEIADAMKKGVPGDMVLVEFRHPLDAPGSFHHALRLCEARIRARAAGHRTLMGDNPRLQEILHRTAHDAEPATNDELQAFKGKFVVDMTLEPITATMRLLSDLDDLELLGEQDADALVSEVALTEALRVAKQTEDGLATASNHTVATEPVQRPPRPAADDRNPWSIAITLDGPSASAMEGLFRKYQHVFGGNFRMVENLHVTLLYLGGGSDTEIASRYGYLRGPEEVRERRERLLRRQGEQVLVQGVHVVWDERVFALQLTDMGSLCSNMYPHVTIALAPGAKAMQSNELIARRGMTDDFYAHLGKWLTLNNMGHHTEAVTAWCTAMGAAALQELAENAEAVVESVQGGPEERAALQKVLASALPAFGEPCGAWVRGTITCQPRHRL